MTTDLTSGDFGRKLREARERRGITLRQIANTTKISHGQLESLERNDISKLPGGIFSRAFVRSYALEVGLDPEATIQEFIERFPQESVTIGHPASTQVEDSEVLESERRVAGTSLWLLAVSIPLAGAIVYFSLAGRGTALPAGEMTAAAPVPTRPAPREPAAPDAPPLTSPAAAPTPPPDAATIHPPAPAGSAASAPVETAAAAGLKIGLSVRRPCWVSASVDGQRVIERLLQTGEQHTLEVRRELVITAGDASAIAWTLDGADARPLGRAGEVVTARVNLTNFKNYLQVR